MMVSILACIFFNLLQGAEAHPLSDYDPVEWVPYRLDYQGWITVNASVNDDGPHDFIVDSGATITSVFANLAEGQDFQPANRGPIRILGLASAKALPAYLLGKISVGRLKLENHTGVILPDWAPPNTPPQGVIGLDLLTRHTVLVDADHRRLEFYSRSAKPDRRHSGWSRTALRPLHIADQDTPLHTVNIRIRGLDIPCVLDLGASGTIFNREALQQLQGGLYINSFGRRSSTTASRVNDIFDDSDTAVAVNMSRLKIGGATWRNKVVIVYDAEIFEALNASSKPFCLAGMDLFTERSFIFDFENERFYIGPSGR